MIKRGFTQRRINLGMFALIILAALVLLINSLIRGASPGILISSAVSALITAGLLGAYLRGWEHARTITALAITVVIGLAIREPFVSEQFDIALFVPVVIALVLCSPTMVVTCGCVVLLILLARAGWVGIYTSLTELVVYVGIIGGMVLSRLAVDSAQRVADANGRAEQARAEAEQRAAELLERNTALHVLLAENAAQRDAIRELSVPLLPLADQTLMLPLVGTFDTSRLLQVQERVLATIYTQRAQDLIIDVTGVPLLDTQLAHGLMKLIDAAQLLGTRVTLVGIRGELAHTLVGLGIDLGAVQVDRDVQAALARLWGRTADQPGTVVRRGR